MTSIYQSVKDGQKMMTTVKTSSLEILYLMDKLLMYCQQYIKVDKSAKKNLTGKIHQKLDILISDIPSIYLEIKKKIVVKLRSFHNFSTWDRRHTYTGFIPEYHLTDSCAVIC